MHLCHLLLGQIRGLRPLLSFVFANGEKDAICYNMTKNSKKLGVVYESIFLSPRSNLRLHRALPPVAGARRGCAAFFFTAHA
jgi:hypothetical protein